MRVLHLTPELPAPGRGGGRAHEYLLCRRLVQRGHQVLNISPALPSEERFAGALRDVGVENWTARRPASHLRETGAALRSEPQVLATALAAPVRALEMRIFWVSIRALVAQALAEWRPDVAVIVHDMAAGWVTGLPDELPAVLGLHDLHWRWYLSGSRQAGALGALPLRLEAARYRRHLLGLLPRFAEAVCVSTVEADELRASCALPVSVIPTGVDTERIRPAAECGGPPRLVFTGTLSYEPNSHGIRWFADRAWPLVRRAVPEATLDIVGRDPPRSVLALARRPGINVVGPVPLVEPYFERAHAVIVPILTGAGVRVKIVEALAAGRAVVSTSLGCEGLPGVEPGRHLLVADTPEQFADAAVRLLNDAPTRQRLAATGRSLAEERYDWRALGDQLEQVLMRAVSWRAGSR
jgi:glycosyltransferase involved in cell wall biosynthesis